MLSFKNWVFTIFSLGLGLLLIWLTFYLTPVDPEQIFTNLQYLSFFYTSLVVVSTLLNLWLTAYKWKLIASKLIPCQKYPKNFFLFYVALGSLVGQFIPQHLGMIGIRSFALRFHKISNLSKGFLTVICEQFFDLLIPLLLLVPALLFIFKRFSLLTTVFVSLSILAITLYTINRWNKYLIFLLERGYGLAKKRVLWGSEATTVEPFFNNEPIFETKFTMYLFCIAVMRYINLILRGFLVVMAGSLNINFWAIVFATPVIQLAMVLSLTPANLGIMEWSWIGVLRLFQVATVESVSFALLQRILGLSSIILIFLCLLISFVSHSFVRFRKSNK